MARAERSVGPVFFFFLFFLFLFFLASCHCAAVAMSGAIDPKDFYIHKQKVRGGGEGAGEQSDGAMPRDATRGARADTQPTLPLLSLCLPLLS